VIKFIVSLLLIASAASSEAAFVQTDDRETWRAPASALAKKNPLAGKTDLVLGGQRLFSKNCAVCHDAGENQKGPDLGLNATQAQSDGELFWKITTGNSRSGMPAFSSLPEGQRWQLVLYVRSFVQRHKQ
jgi:mono/diheme cytochrome c family protein